MSLPELANVTKLSPNVTRILGQNPGRYTLQGTNTYLITDSATSPKSLILLDTAQGIPSYIPLLSPLIPTSSSSDQLSSSQIERIDIVLSHWHEDHIGGLGDVLKLLTEEKKISKIAVWKFPLPDDPEGKEQELDARVGGYEIEHAKIQELKDGQILNVGEQVQLKVIHTPGHTKDSISLLFEPTKSEPKKLFTFDTILGHGTAVFEDLGEYMNSLNVMLKEIGEEEVELYPGHGETIIQGKEKIEEYRKHRQEREDQVVEGLKATKGDTQATELTESIYANTIPDELKPAATRGLLLHLEKLEREGKVDRRVAMGEEAENAPLPGWNDRWQWRGEGSDSTTPAKI